MAYTLSDLGNLIVTSLHGRQIGLDSGGCLVGPPCFRSPVEDITTTVATSISGTGVTRILSSAASVHTLQQIPIGAEKTLYQTSTFTSSIAIGVAGNVIIQSTFGSSFTHIELAAKGGTVKLLNVGPTSAGSTV